MMNEPTEEQKKIMMIGYKELMEQERETNSQRKKREEAELIHRIGSRASYYQMLAIAYYQCTRYESLGHLIPTVNAAYEHYSQEGDKAVVVELMRLIAEAK